MSLLVLQVICKQFARTRRLASGLLEPQPNFKQEHPPSASGTSGVYDLTSQQIYTVNLSGLDLPLLQVVVAHQVELYLVDCLCI